MLLGFLWWCFLGFFGLTISNANTQNSCKTPDNEVGSCVLVLQCQGMVQLLGTLKSPISPEVTQRLMSFNCGSDPNGHKVCCPSGSIALKPLELFHTRINAPDVNDHKNINLLPEMCGHFDSTKRIVHGNNSDLNEFPWSALLQYRYMKTNDLRFACGGTIISKNYILTAAHCITGLTDKKLVSVRVGEYNLKNQSDCEKHGKKTFCNPAVQNLNFQEVIPHLQYDPQDKTRINDIGLLRVDTINFDVPNAKPVCLPIGVARDFSYENVIVTGWGIVNPWSRETADILQKVSLPVFDKATCSKTYKDVGIPLNNAQICAGGDDKDSCGGDSGGPMLVLTPIGDEGNIIYVQHGVISFGPRLCGNSEYPGIYTLVKFYMDWILDNLKP